MLRARTILSAVAVAFALVGAKLTWNQKWHQKQPAETARKNTLPSEREQTSPLKYPETSKPNQIKVTASEGNEKSNWKFCILLFWVALLELKLVWDFGWYAYKQVKTAIYLPWWRVDSRQVEETALLQLNSQQGSAAVGIRSEEKTTAPKDEPSIEQASSHSQDDVFTTSFLTTSVTVISEGTQRFSTVQTPSKESPQIDEGRMKIISSQQKLSEIQKEAEDTSSFVQSEDLSPDIVGEYRALSADARRIPRGIVFPTECDYSHATTQDDTFAVWPREENNEDNEDTHTVLNTSELEVISQWRQRNKPKGYWKAKFDPFEGEPSMKGIEAELSLIENQFKKIGGTTEADRGDGNETVGRLAICTTCRLELSEELEAAQKFEMTGDAKNMAELIEEISGGGDAGPKGSETAEKYGAQLVKMLNLMSASESARCVVCGMKEMCSPLDAEYAEESVAETSESSVCGTAKILFDDVESLRRMLAQVIQQCSKNQVTSNV